MGEGGRQPGRPGAVRLSCVVTVEDVAGVVLRGARLGEVCVLVQAVSISTLTQTRSGRFMTIDRLAAVPARQPTRRSVSSQRPAKSLDRTDHMAVANGDGMAVWVCHLK